MSCSVLIATPMAFSSVLSCSLYDQILRRASERSLLHMPTTAPVWSVLSLVGTELFPGGVETLVFVYLLPVNYVKLNLVFGRWKG